MNQTYQDNPSTALWHQQFKDDILRRCILHIWKTKENGDHPSLHTTYILSLKLNSLTQELDLNWTKTEYD